MRTVALGLALLLQEPALPALTGRVVDAGNVLSPDEESRLTDRLETLERETSTQIVIATIPTLLGGSIEDYTFRLAESWQIGQSELDNGVVILVAVQDRRVRIEVGYGLEPVIPDGLAGRIIRERIHACLSARGLLRGLECRSGGPRIGCAEGVSDGATSGAIPSGPSAVPTGCRLWRSGRHVLTERDYRQRDGSVCRRAVGSVLRPGIYRPRVVRDSARSLVGAFFDGFVPWWARQQRGRMDLPSNVRWELSWWVRRGRLRWWWVRRRRFQRRRWRLWRRRRKWELVTCRFRGDFAVT